MCVNYLSYDTLLQSDWLFIPLVSIALQKLKTGPPKSHKGVETIGILLSNQKLPVYTPEYKCIYGLFMLQPIMVYI